MKILVVEPEKAPMVKEIDGSLESMQKIVGGYIEAIYPLDDPIALVCNEEGKINGLSPNRVLVDKDGNVLDVICGTFFLCEVLPTEENFTGLSDEEVERYMEMMCDGIMVLQYKKEE